MKSRVQLSLQTLPEQDRALLALQRTFAQVCNSIAPVVAQTRVWNRVALHHMVYKSLRARFPQLGSQMVCNAIYAVSRMARIVYQHPASPFLVAKMPPGPLPVLHFVDAAPVYFDRHTLSLKDGRLSLFTLDGRMRFNLSLSEGEERAFQSRRLIEVELTRDAAGRFLLRFSFDDGAQEDEEVPLRAGAGPLLIPQYVQVEEAA